MPRGRKKIAREASPSGSSGSTTFQTVPGEGTRVYRKRSGNRRRLTGVMKEGGRKAKNRPIRSTDEEEVARAKRSKSSPPTREFVKKQPRKTRGRLLTGVTDAMVERVLANARENADAPVPDADALQFQADAAGQAPADDAMDLTESANPAPIQSDVAAQNEVNGDVFQPSMLGQMIPSDFTEAMLRAFKDPRIRRSLGLPAGVNMPDQIWKDEAFADLGPVEKAIRRAKSYRVKTAFLRWLDAQPVDTAHSYDIDPATGRPWMFDRTPMPCERVRVRDPGFNVAFS